MYIARENRFFHREGALLLYGSSFRCDHEHMILACVTYLDASFMLHAKTTEICSRYRKESPELNSLRLLVDEIDLDGSALLRNHATRHSGARNLSSHTLYYSLLHVNLVSWVSEKPYDETNRMVPEALHDRIWSKMTSMTSARIITSRSNPEAHLNVSESYRNFNNQENPHPSACQLLTPKKLLEVLRMHDCCV